MLTRTSWPASRALRSLLAASRAQAPLATLACLGPCNSGKGQMLGKLVGAAVEDEGGGELECAISEDEKLAVLNSAGFGERPGAADPADDSAADTAVAVCVSQGLVLTTFFREFLSEPAEAVGRLSELRPAMELLVRMSREPGAPPPRKRALILLVREYEPESGVAPEQLRETFTRLLEAMWARLPAARGRGPALALSDVLDVQVAPLPPPGADGAALSEALSELKAKLRAAASPDKAPAAAELLASLAAASKLAGGASGAGAVSADELVAALACARAANAAFDEYVGASAQLHARAAAPARAPLETLAEESSQALGAALGAYDEATAAHAGSDVRARRRSALQAAILNDLRPLYSYALQLSRVAAVVDLTRRSANLTSGEVANFHADLQAAVDEVSSAFREHASSLRMAEAQGAWSSGLEERMLQQVGAKAHTSARTPADRALCAMRARSAEASLRALPSLRPARAAQELQQMGAEMVRRAQLLGLYAPPSSRVPTGVSLHWLSPNPFGKDLRTDQLSGSDRLSYSQRAKSLLRLSPMSYAHRAKGSNSVPFKGGVSLTDEDLVLTKSVRTRAQRRPPPRLSALRPPAGASPEP